MFKWSCFGLAGVFVVVSLWMLNDIRMTVRGTAREINDGAAMLNRNLPPLVEKTRESADTIAANLPEVVDRTKTAADVLAELAEDIRQLKELAGLTQNPRDKNLVAYADGVLTLIEQSGGVIGVSKNIGNGLKNTVPVKDWVSGARKEALFLTLLVRSKREMVDRLAKTKLGFNWWIEPRDGPPQRLLDWLRKHHPETRELEW